MLAATISRPFIKNKCFVTKCDNTMPDNMIFRKAMSYRNKILKKRNCNFCFPVMVSKQEQQRIRKVMPPTFNLNKKFQNNTSRKMFQTNTRIHWELKLCIFLGCHKNMENNYFNKPLLIIGQFSEISQLNASCEINL